MNSEKIVAQLEEFLAVKLENSGAEGYVIGLSGGLDSAVAATLAVNAVGAGKVSGMVMPGDPSLEENMRDARQLAEKLDIDYTEVGIEPYVERFGENRDISEKTRGNLRARVRMVYQYMKANEENLLVLGSSNKTELEIGYFTKYGDGATDVTPIADLYKTEVRKLAEFLEIDSKFIEKQPTAGLWDGQNDEDEIGYSYDVVDEVLKRLLEGQDVGTIAGETGIERKAVEHVKSLHENSAHKREGPVSPGSH